MERRLRRRNPLFGGRIRKGDEALLRVEVTGDEPAALGAERRVLGGTARHRERAARMEAAAGRRIERARHLAAPARPPRAARRGRSAARPRTAPSCTDASASSATACASPHSTILPRYMTAIAWLMCATAARSCAMKRYETPRRSWRSRQQVQDLRADRHVERGHGLVEHDELRRERERARDGDALALAAGELVRVERGRALGQADEVEQLAPRAGGAPPRVERRR